MQTRVLEQKKTTYRKEKFRLLVIEDNPGDFLLIKEHLSSISHVGKLDHASRFSDVNDLVGSGRSYHAVLLDLKLPDLEGEELIRKTIDLVSPAPVIVLTGFSDMSFSVESLKMGVSDYILKDRLNSHDLWKSIRYSIERNTMTSKLRRSENRYRELFENNPSPMLIWAPGSGKIIDSNREAQIKYGYTKKEFLKLSFGDLQLKMSDHSPDEANRLNELQSSDPSKKVWRHRKKCGEIIFVEMKGHLVDYKGETATLMLLNDVTELITLQEKMIENVIQAEEQERNRVSQELHDGIVQQLVACGMFTQNLLDELDNPRVLEKKINRLYELIKKTTLHTRDLSHNLQSAEFEVMSISDLFRQLVRQLTATSDIEFTLKDHIQDSVDLSTEVKVNLYRIVQELCANIVKHSGATEAEIIAELAGEYLSVTIKDNGKNFDPDSSMTNGAGLVNVNSRIFRLRGILNHKSLPEKGMVVNIEVPVSV